MIELSPSAAGEITRLQAKHRRTQQGNILRIGVATSGCAGFSYQMEFVQTCQPQDQVYECLGITLAVDPQSLPYLEGLVVDYTEDLMGGGFRFHNPHATQTCGCGSSFAVNSTATPVQSC